MVGEFKITERENIKNIGIKIKNSLKIFILKMLLKDIFLK